MIKKVALWLSLISGLLVLCSIAFGLYQLSSDVIDLKASQETMEIKLELMKEDVNEKEIACEVLNERLKATFSNGKYSHYWCKDSVAGGKG